MNEKKLSEEKKLKFVTLVQNKANKYIADMLSFQCDHFAH